MSGMDPERGPKRRKLYDSADEVDWEDVVCEKGSTPRIALGEDDVEMRRILSGRLRKDGYEVVEAENGRQLIDAVASAVRGRNHSVFATIVSDIRMPEMTGLRFLAELRKHDRVTPVILITAFGDPSTRAEAYRLGAGAVLDKPFELDEFCRLVRQFAPQNGGSPRIRAT